MLGPISLSIGRKSPNLGESQFDWSLYDLGACEARIGSQDTISLKRAFWLEQTTEINRWSKVNTINHFLKTIELLLWLNTTKPSDLSLPDCQRWMPFPLLVQPFYELSCFRADLRIQRTQGPPRSGKKNYESAPNQIFGYSWPVWLRMLRFLAFQADHQPTIVWYGEIFGVRSRLIVFFPALG